ncbi:MAG: hypothetical protein M3X11_15325 [Acidobacteriota bacterium]|nr:hypothetical protein [Acidobacteriota bacterium]
MPATKKSSSSKTAKAKQKSGSAISAKKVGNYGPSYIGLRTVLDAVEIAAIRYYFAGKTAAERATRHEKMRMMFVPLAQELSSLTDPNEGQIARCPPGYHSCGGCCLPYECPE